MSMIRINIHEAKTHLSYLSDGAQKGGNDHFVQSQQPTAEIRPLPSPLTGKRPIGLAEGQFSVPAAFFEPLPNDVLDAFPGKAT